MNAPTRTIVLASRNEDKLRELREICAGLPLEVKSSLDYPGLPEVSEDGTSALGNACRKALVTAGWTGEIAIADDTTFQVRTLGDLPDVFASRFAGRDATYEDNVALVLELMADVPDDGREVRFETSMVWVDPRPVTEVNPADVVPARMRWVHDPFARRATSPEAAAEVAAEHHKAWMEYKAWFGTLPVGWGADVARVERIVEELVTPYLAGEPAPAADAVRLEDVRAFWAEGPHDHDAPALSVRLPGDPPGRSTCAPVWLEVSAEGRLLGHLTRQPLGRGGFGYDPVVMPVGFDRTLAELSPDEKNAVSHRGLALRRLLGAVAHVYGIAMPRVAEG